MHIPGLLTTPAESKSLGGRIQVCIFFNKSTRGFCCVTKPKPMTYGVKNVGSGWEAWVIILDLLSDFARVT